MAEHPLGSFHINPPCWRIAVPFLVGLLPLPTVTAYKVQALVFVTATGVLLFLFLHRAAGYCPTEAFLGLILYYAYGPATKLLIQGPYSPDPASFTILVCALWCLYLRKDMLLAVILAAGVAVKETTVLVIPLIYTIRANRLADLKLLLRTACVAAPALAVLFTIRSLIPAFNGVDDYVSQLGPALTQVHLGITKFDHDSYFLDAIQRVLRFRFQQTPINIVRDLTFGSIGLLFVLPFFALVPKRTTHSLPDHHTPSACCSNRELLLRFLPFLAGCLLGWLVALNSDRRFAYAFPFLIVLSLNGIRTLALALGINSRWFIPVFLLQYIFNLLQPHTTTVPFDLAAAAFLVCLGLLLSFRDTFAHLERAWRNRLLVS
ncbi:MAG: hypothetical protein IT167_18285 [Bryobacterales bacterium]|nr:hypothetical protein [Bryobacterales bacterium]